MKLRRVMTDRGFQVEILSNEQWIRLAELPSLQEFAQDHHAPVDLGSNAISVLKLGKVGWDQLAQEIESLKPVAGDAVIHTPFDPLSFRDFMLFEKHMIDAARGYTQKFMPGAYRLTSAVERITKKPFPKFRPHPLWYKQPIYYFGNHLNFSTNGIDIPWPTHTRALDYELELGAVLSAPLHNASEDEAEQAIGGFVVLNDLSARDLQVDEMNSGFGPQKAKHFANTMSPTMITADEVLPNINNLRGSVTINSKKVADCSTEAIQHSLPQAIAFCSNNEHLFAGEFFGSGTLPGGSGMENGHWLKPGDHLELSIEGIGYTSNNISPGESG